MVKNSTGKNENGLSATSIVDSIKSLPKNRIPPVEKWNPPFCGNLDIRIARDGTWFYLGTPIGRPELVKLFSSILKKEEDKYFLVTPVETSSLGDRLQALRRRGQSLICGFHSVSLFLLRNLEEWF